MRGVHGATHFFPPEKWWLLGCERDQLDRSLRRANAEQSRQLKETRCSAGVIVRARQIARRRERIVVRSYDEFVARKRSKVSDDVSIRSASVGEGLLGDADAVSRKRSPM